MSERQIKILGIFFSFLVTTVNGWVFETDDNAVVLIRLFFIIISGILQWETAHFVIRIGRKKYPHLSLVKQRVTFTAVIFFLLSVGLSFLGDFFLDNVIDKKPFAIDTARIVTNVAGALYFAFTAIGLFEAVYYYSNYNQSELEKEELLRANLQSQFDSLKGQVNPHFLFNSLNSLSSLITKDPAKAEQFVEELSTVYRYLLKSNEQELNTVREEISFIRAYGYLLTTRFGNNLHIEISVADECQDYLLPPLTLQLLVENAVKHNIISRDEPLKIKIFTSDSDRLHVTNNLQKKSREVPSEKVGLKNIMTKYKLLRQQPIQINESEHEFAVILPLIKESLYESIHH